MGNTLNVNQNQKRVLTKVKKNKFKIEKKFIISPFALLYALVVCVDGSLVIGKLDSNVLWCSF